MFTYYWSATRFRLASHAAMVEDATERFDFALAHQRTQLFVEDEDMREEYDRSKFDEFDDGDSLEFDRELYQKSKVAAKLREQLDEHRKGPLALGTGNKEDIINPDAAPDRLNLEQARELSEDLLSDSNYKANAAVHFFYPLDTYTDMTLYERSAFKIYSNLEWCFTYLDNYFIEYLKNNFLFKIEGLNTDKISTIAEYEETRYKTNSNFFYDIAASVQGKEAFAITALSYGFDHFKYEDTLKSSTLLMNYVFFPQLNYRLWEDSDLRLSLGTYESSILSYQHHVIFWYNELENFLFILNKQPSLVTFDDSLEERFYHCMYPFTENERHERLRSMQKTFYKIMPHDNFTRENQWHIAWYRKHWRQPFGYRSYSFFKKRASWDYINSDFSWITDESWWDFLNIQRQDYYRIFNNPDDPGYVDYDWILRICKIYYLAKLVYIIRPIRSGLSGNFVFNRVVDAESAHVSEVNDIRVKKLFELMEADVRLETAKGTILVDKRCKNYETFTVEWGHTDKGLYKQVDVGNLGAQAAKLWVLADSKLYWARPQFADREDTRFADLLIIPEEVASGRVVPTYGDVVTARKQYVLALNEKYFKTDPSRRSIQEQLEINETFESLELQFLDQLIEEQRLTAADLKEPDIIEDDSFFDGHKKDEKENEA